jgi:ribosomal protein S18
MFVRGLARDVCSDESILHAVTSAIKRARFLALLPYVAD